MAFATRRSTRPLATFLSLAFLASLAIGAKSAYLQPTDIDVEHFLPGPPAQDSAEHREEIATMLQWQAKRTATDAARCRSEVDVTVFVFAEVLGDWFNAKNLPVTASVMDQAYVDAKNISAAAKKKWNRTRPMLEDSRIMPCVPLEHTASYPSGHATRGVMWATVLSEIFPEHKDALMARGLQIGEDRAIAGMHWPSDVVAGQKLGAEVAKRLMDNPDFQVQMKRMKDECLVTH